ncbi:hypothetical protein E2320_018795 [Naja naja]|nr:hypothetical protein E2320_018795 [Naja naja]
MRRILKSPGSRKNKQPTQALSLRGDKGNMWQQAHVPINPAGPFQKFKTFLSLIFFFPQIIFEGVRGTGSEGDIAIDDVTLKKVIVQESQLSQIKVIILSESYASLHPKFKENN